MRAESQNYIRSALRLTLSALLCLNLLPWAHAQSSEPINKNSGGSTGVAEAVNNTINGSNGNSTGGSSSNQVEGRSANQNNNSPISMFGDSSSQSQGSSTPKPDGNMIDKAKDMFKEGKEGPKGGNEKDDKKGESGSGSLMGSLQSSGQSSGSSSNQQLASSSTQMGTMTTAKPEGLMDMMSDMAKKGKDAIKDVIEPKREAEEGSRGSLLDKLKGGDKKEGLKESLMEKKEAFDKVKNLVFKGGDVVHKIEDKAKEVGEKVTKAIDDHVLKPMQSTSGSGQQTSEGQMTPQASAVAQLKGSEKEKYLVEQKKKQDSELPSKPSNLKDIVTEAKSRGILPQNEDRSVLRGNHDDEKTVAVEIFDKAHEISKIPVEKALKPIDKLLGYEKDPLLRIYDNSHEILRKPLEMIAKPVESVFTGAFKTSDEAKKDSEKLLATTSEQERKDAKVLEEKTKKENRSIAGQIADRTVDLATKPIEIVLKPFDQLLGYGKSGKKNPLLHLIEELYALSKKPVDKLAKPFESILKKMADGDQMYQVAIRFNADKDDPKLFTRLADGYLNIADRVMTKPLELFMKPLDHVLGFDEPGKKNPIVEAAHSLKNATKIGVELFTKPIDRIIKDIADIGDFKSESEREAFYLRQKEEASRLVKVLDKMHDLAQAPFEIILRPVGKVLGTHKDGKKDSLLRAWDVVHQVMRTPFQVISKPVEDAILGEKPRKHHSNSEAQSKASQLGAKEEAIKKNIFVEKIKKVEKFATKPLDIITAPIRRMILGEDNAKVGSDTEKNNREIQAKSKAGDNQAESKSGLKGEKRPDKIMSTLEKMNNVILKPLEVITQPLADILSSEKVENKLDKLQQHQPQSKQSDKNQTQQAPPSFQARAQAAQKKN